MKYASDTSVNPSFLQSFWYLTVIELNCLHVCCFKFLFPEAIKGRDEVGHLSAYTKNGYEHVRRLYLECFLHLINNIKRKECWGWYPFVGMEYIWLYLHVETFHVKKVKKVDLVLWYLVAFWIHLTGRLTTILVECVIVLVNNFILRI